MIYVYWIALGIGVFTLLVIFWRRYLLTRKGAQFEQEMHKADERLAKQETEEMPPTEEAPTDLQLKRQAEQKAKDEHTRRIREAKKAFKKADVHFTKGDYGIAEKFLLQVLSFDNDHLDANLKLGLLYLHQENLPRSEFFFQKLIDLKENPIYFSNLAMVLFQQKRLEEAAKLYERAIELDDKRAARFVSLAHVYHELGELERALEKFEQASRLEPRNLEYLWILLDYYEKFSRFEHARRVLNKILELDPYNKEAQGKLTLVEERLLGGEESIDSEEELNEEGEENNKNAN